MKRVIGAVLIALALSAARLEAQVIDGARAIAATGVVNFDVTGMSSITVTISGTWVGTFVPKADPDGSGPLVAFTWPAQKVESDGSQTETIEITGNGTYILSNPGYMRIVFDWTRTSGSASLTAVRGFGLGSSSAEISGDIEAVVEAQPASDPHFVKCSDGSVAAPCAVSGPLTDAELRADPVIVGDGNGALNVICDSGCDGGGGGGGAAQSDNSALGDLTAGGALFTTSSPSITDGNVGAFRMDGNRVLFAQPAFGGTISAAGAGSSTAATQRVIEATDSQLSAGVGATGDAAATAGSTGSLSAKLRLITSQLDALQTELNAKTEPANTQTISGTVTANAGTNLNTSALLTTTAHDGAFGTAGSADPQVRSVQGIASGTPLSVDSELAAAAALADAAGIPTTAMVGAVLMCKDSGATVSFCVDHAQGDTTSGKRAPMVQGSVTTAAPSYTTAQIHPLSLTPEGNLRTVSSRCSDDSKVQSAEITSATSGNLQIIALSASQVIYICGWDVIASGTVNVQLVYGTGTNCGTGETNITGVYQLTAQAGLARANGGAVQAKTAASNALCIELSGAVQVDGLLTYVKE